MSTRISTFEEDVRDRLSVDGSLSYSQDSINSQLEPVADSPGGTDTREMLEPQVVYDDTRTREQRTQRTRTSNLPSYPSDNFRSLTGANDGNPYEQKTPTVQKQQPKYKYVVMPQSLLGIKLQEGETFVGGLLSEGLTGAGIGGVFGGAGSLIGAGVGLISGIFGGRKKDIWFDVVYKDALQEAFQQLGLQITDKPFGGNSLTVKSQFGIDSKVSVEEMVKVISSFNSRLAQEFKGKPQIVNGLAGVRIQDTYDKSRTLFRFAVKYEQPKLPEDAKKTSQTKPSPVKSTVGIASLIGILLSLRS